ncbi:uncharacterized protein RAG0_17268 [Rhynchosporium agropyri]|uniref:Uncharacterized protein n=2 Tax=Rhynchosporium TaxID=38037 RepID=A0A1E1MWI5_RHYSE|nr:uncharacterized protein RAG0_17268 [Rhynchosporium agropyri]CZT53417.1 uncharacterized protein RSE6_14965 [Rhynchosporium secalis]
MQFTTLFLATLAVIVPATMACNPGQDCCWGGEAGGWKGCMNQHRNFFREDANDRCNDLSRDWCSNQGVTEAECDADCCSISTHWGIGCP